MATWYGSMNPPQKRTFWACLMGWALDAMDVQLFAFVIPTLITLWGMTKSEAGIIGTSALITSAIGGVLAGLLADRIGRVKVLQITIVWFAVFTGASAFTHSFHELLITRSLQGLGFGGEWAAGAVLIGEVVDKRIRGRAVGTVQAGWPIGYALAALAYFTIFSLLPAETAWRALFMVGILPALSVIWLRRNVKESEAYLAVKTAGARGSIGGNLKLIFSRGIAGKTLTASLLAGGALGGNYTILTWLVTYLRQTHSMSVGVTTWYLAINIFGSFCGYVGAAYLSDMLGRRKTFVLSALGATLAILTYTFLPVVGVTMLLLGFLVGMFQSGIVSGMGACFSELFPAQIRASAGGFSYNFGRAFGSLIPAAVGITSARYGLGPSIGAWAAASYALVFLAALAMPETRFKELELHV
ncbi:MFS transporter [Paraburkholderia saeva]|uniref:Metabolite transport protein YjhB n=1 Tax=Paraburkholderia saeva TaxID=2777537 RepID=A0A9N8RTA8_9BURK|nr:MFS transporter [Paraburkholderia saeva]CAG4887975.1 Putative metabolite transport protein YjhB [Paraburkholderia saeva]CAG4901571.1 Putative metabolite transport protein YjhB [Paraburkholderia saeva]